MPSRVKFSSHDGDEEQVSQPFPWDTAQTHDFLLADVSSRWDGHKSHSQTRAASWWNSLAQHHRAAAAMTIFWPAQSTGSHLPSKSYVAIPLLSLSSQLWFTPLLDNAEVFVLRPRIWLCQHPQPGSGTGQGHSIWPTCSLAASRRVFLQEAGGWPVLAALGEWTRWQLFPIWKWKDSDLNPSESLVRMKGMFSLFFQVKTWPRVHVGSESLLCYHQNHRWTGNSDTKATTNVKLQQGRSQKKQHECEQTSLGNPWLGDSTHAHHGTWV